jgi:hypothetical protein
MTEHPKINELIMIIEIYIRPANGERGRDGDS